MLTIHEHELANAITELLELALQEDAGPVRHEIGKIATDLKEAADWTDEDVAEWGDGPSGRAQWTHEFLKAYNRA